MYFRPYAECVDYLILLKSPKRPNIAIGKELQAQTVLLFLRNLIFPAASDGQKGGAFIKIDEADAH